MICVSVGRTRHKMMILEMQEAAKQGAELIELRLDFLARAIDLKRLLAVKACPLVATIRRVEDGGRWSQPEEKRLMELRQIIASGQFEWVDVETDIAEHLRRFGKTKRIVSYHNLREMPNELEQIHAKMCSPAQDADVVKLAVRAEHPKDNWRVLQLVKNASKPTVAFCLGDLGTLSRILVAKFGAPFTYAAFNKERGLAPGILGSDEMRRLYRYDSIGPTTQVFAVIGDPIAHSLSPLAHNTALQMLGLNAVYVPLRVPKADLEETLTTMRQLPISGYSVTLPLKELACQLAKDRDEIAELTQAANTLIPKPSGSFAAYNTDCAAAIAALREAMKDMESGDVLTGRNILLLGAGGTARALAYGLHQQGALVKIANRTLSRALDLAEQIGCRSVDWSARNATSAEIIINCTPVGMHPNVDEMPLHPSVFRPGLVVLDCVYNPETTMLIRAARERGCRVVTGVEMFLRQAAAQFQLFTGKPAPLSAMSKAVRQALSPLRNAAEEGSE